MKKLSVYLLVVLMGIFSWPFQSFAQSDYDRNVLKLQLTPLIFNSYGVQFEKMVNERISIAVSSSYMPSFSNFLKNQVETYYDDPQSLDDLQSLDFKRFSFTPEVRFYLGKKEGPRGFYIAPYLNYSSYQLSLDNFTVTLDSEGVPEEYQGEFSRNFNLNGAIKGISGGVLFGTQFKLGKSAYLDWWILGASYGGSNGDLEVISSQPLSQEWQDAVRDRVNEIDIPFVEINTTVSANGATSTLSGPWANVRTGLSLGFKF
jgi:hypothetical protein